jgi:electron transfer flavoprotein alpha subunit
MSILAVLEKANKETLAAAQDLGNKLNLPVSAAVFGSTDPEAKLEKIYRLQHPLLAEYTADAYTATLEQLIRKVQPTVVLFPHTYQVRDYAPKLATRLNRELISDVVHFKADVMVRQLFQGKLNADYRLTGDAPHLVSMQAGAYSADQVEPGTPTVETFTPTIDESMIRTKMEPPFQESERAVDLTAADKIVSVGRGIKEASNIALIEKLAKAMGAEIAASRPICDNGWLPMERQVGSSGQTVSPKLYLAIGISGAIQHLVGMKGARTIVAINKDPHAPIFEVADYGIAGDLFEVVPALIEELTAKQTG